MADYRMPPQVALPYSEVVVYPEDERSDDSSESAEFLVVPKLGASHDTLASASRGLPATATDRSTTAPSEYNYIADLPHLREKPVAGHCEYCDKRLARRAARKQKKSQTKQFKFTGASRMPAMSEGLFYELKFKELVGNSLPVPHIDRIDVAFQLLDDIIPHLGKHEPAMARIRDELYESVYSDELTSGDNTKHYRRLPYFNLSQRYNLERLDREQELTEERDKLMQKLREANLAIGKLETEKAALLREKEDLLDHIIRNDAKIRELKDEIERLTQRLETELRNVSELKMTVEHESTMYQSRINEERAAVEELKHFEEMHTGLGKAFSKADYESVLDRQASLINHNRFALIKVELEQAKRLLQQLDIIRSKQIDEYQRERDTVKVASREVKEIGKVFAHEQEALEAESLQLRNRIIQLETELSNDPDKMAVNALERWKTKGGRTARENEDSPTTPTAPPVQPVVPSLPFLEEQRRTYPSKYAIVIEASEKGLVWTPLREDSWCSQCGDKTVICPHRNFNGSVIRLPPNTTALRLTRPTLVLKQEKVSVWTTETEIPKSSLWDMFRKKGFRIPERPRVLTLPLLTSAINELYEWKLANDGQELSDTPPLSMQQVLFEHAMRTYTVASVAEYTTYSVLAATEQLRLDDQGVELFHRLLSGTEPDCVWGTLVYIKRLLRYIHWEPPPTINAVFRDIYHGYPSNSIEMHATKFAASGIPCTEAGVYRHLLMQILTKNEMRREKFVSKVMHFDVYKHRYLSLREFVDCMETIFPPLFCNVAVRHYAALQSGYPTDQVPVEKLAEAGAFMELYGLYLRRHDSATALQAGFKDFEQKPAE